MNYVVLLKTHFWDEFMQRQLQRLCSKTDPSRICVMVDETGGPVGPVNHPWVVRLTVEATARIGLAPKAAWGHVFHYNVDYPLYFFYQQHPSYDYYVMTEYDAVSNIDFDELIARMSEQKIDGVFFPLRTPMRDWEYTRHHAWIYPENELHGALLCTSAYSNRAVEHLFNRRRELTRQDSEKPLPFWPFCEAFVPTECARAGLHVRSFAEFYNMDDYECWPPSHEDDVADGIHGKLIHPVLTGDRYLQSTIAFEKRMMSYFFPHSPFRRKLERFPREERDRVFYRTLRLRLVKKVRDRFMNLLNPRYVTWRLKKLFSRG